MASRKDWETAACAVSGRIVNGYLTKDWVLGVLYRASVATWSAVAGLGPAPADIPAVESVMLDEVITSHLEYRIRLPEILEHVGFRIHGNKFDEEDDEEQSERQFEESEKARKKEEALKAKAEAAKKNEEERTAGGGRKSWFTFGGGAKRAPGDLRDSSSSVTGSDDDSNINGNQCKVDSTIASGKLPAQSSSWWSLSRPSSTSKEVDPTSLPSKTEAEKDDVVLQPKEIESTLPPLVVDLKETKLGNQAEQEAENKAPSMLR